MTKDTYPKPGVTPGRPRLAYTNPTPPTGEFGNNRAEQEERIFHHATHYNIVRFRAGGGSEITTTNDFIQALTTVMADDEHRYLMYVVTGEGEAFCMSPKDYGKFAEQFTRERAEKQS